MKNKALKNRIFIGLFLLLCLLPLGGMLVFGPSKAAANEILASKPKLVGRDGELNWDYLSDTADYVADRFWLRQSCVTLWSFINAGFFNTSVDDSVILGSEGNLYYADDLPDYTGQQLPEGQLRSAARNLSLISRYVESTGADFVFTVAPNKSSLYTQYMPSWVPQRLAAANVNSLPNCLHEFSVTYADLCDAFRVNRNILYYSTDSHWNSQGAALGADVILSAAGIESSYYNQSFAAGEEHTGDLYEMLFPAGKYTETDMVPVKSFSFTTEANPNGGNATTISASCPEGSGKLICWRDSFGVALYPYLAQSFESSYFSRSNTYDLTLVDNTVSLVVIELVERNIPWLLTKLPIIPAAPVGTGPAAKGQTVTCECSTVKASSGQLYKICCSLPEALYDWGEAAYVSCDGAVYEALVGYEEDGTAVFTIYLEAEPAGEISAICSCNGIITEYTAVK